MVAGELTAPAEGQRDTAEDGENLVATAQSAVEALVTASPNKVDGSYCLRLAKDFVEAHLPKNMYLTMISSTFIWRCLYVICSYMGLYLIM